MAIEHNPATLESGEKPVVHHTENGAYRNREELVRAAADTIEEEVNTSRKVLFKKYWPAVTYSMLLSLALVMEGMDVGLINNFFAQAAFIKKFQTGIDEDGEPYISARWQGIVGAGNNCGSIIGLLINGYLQARFGSKRVYIVCRLPPLSSTLERC